MEDEDMEYDSTWPSQVAEENEKKKITSKSWYMDDLNFFDFKEEPDNRSWLKIIRDLF